MAKDDIRYLVAASKCTKGILVYGFKIKRMLNLWENNYEPKYDYNYIVKFH